jgi:hypothetical protein
MAVNQESLDRANAFLAAVADQVEVGGTLEESPTEIGKRLGLSQPLVSARAVRALLARRRLEAVDGKYRLLDTRPVEPDEKESIQRPRRPRAPRRAPTGSDDGRSSRPTYSQLGREAVERLIELGREVASLRASMKSAREEARVSRVEKDEAVRRAETLAARVRELEARAEMAEANLRTLLAAAKSAGRDVPVAHDEMEAILGVLKGGGEAPASPSEAS